MFWRVNRCIGILEPFAFFWEPTIYFICTLSLILFLLAIAKENTDLSKAFTTILLLFVMLVPSWLGYLVLRYQKVVVQEDVKERMGEGFEEEELVELRFSHKETKMLLRWEHAGEFEYRGQMYDIIKKESTDDSLFVWCFWDQEETRLNQELAELFREGQHTDSQKEATKDKLQDFYKSLFIKEEPVQATSQLYFTNQTKAHYLFYFKSADFEPPTPPPRIYPINNRV